MTSFRYAVIAADGQLSHHEGALDWDAVIGHEGKARVRLPDLAVTGWANDCGLLFPDRYPRNVVGSCVLLSLGAPLQPYAGPVVFTGWDSGNTLRGRLEIVPLPNPEFLTSLHADVQAALEGRPANYPAKWVEAIREFADYVRTAETPRFTFDQGSPW